MAKKNLSSLMNGIIGSQEPAQETSAKIDNSDNRQNTDADASARESSKRISENKSSDCVRATFLLAPETVRKIKYISVMEDRLQKDIVAEALNDYIQHWEIQNGGISLKK